jgi:hypothetical protein
MRLATHYILESLQILRGATGLELITSIIFLQILDANTDVIHEQAQREGRFLALDDVAPDALRQPVSVYSVSQALNLPYETTRRHIQLLIDEGLCRRIKGRGIIVTAAALSSPAMIAAVLRNSRNLNALVEAVPVPEHVVEMRRRSVPA